MKTNYLKLAMLVFLSLITAVSFAQEKKESKKITKNDKEIKTVCFKSNMTCNSCANTIKESIAYEKGVKDLKVNLDNNTITIKYKADKTSEEQLSEAIIDLGFEAKKQEIKESESEYNMEDTSKSKKPKKEDSE